MALKFGSGYNILTLNILIIIGSFNECIGNENHLHIVRTLNEISYELDESSVCKHYEPSPTHQMRACIVGHLKHDVHELQLDLGQALRTYELEINTGIEEEERKGMYTEYTYQKTFTGDSLSWVQNYSTIYNMLQEISLNMTVMDLLVGSGLLTKFLHSNRRIMCQLQAILKIGSFAKEDTHLQLTSRRSLVMSRNIENRLFTNYRQNFFIRNFLTARDALNEIVDVLKLH
ncbi:hypothetical protein ACJMK2_005119 [Sinanodonta woodiana]|uniref:Uncharacterized protein n=1 Tax=Sinanodonta woodiana TaxID=1069815 RepID=A0ABD3VP40_SINWO